MCPLTAAESHCGFTDAVSYFCVLSAALQCVCIVRKVPQKQFLKMILIVAYFLNVFWFLFYLRKYSSIL